MRPLRLLKQVTDTYISNKGNIYNNPVQIYAHAREAESWSHAKAIGIFQNHGATVTTAGDDYPSGRSQAVSQNGQQRSGRARSAGGFPPGNVVTLFGPTAISTTDTGFRAMSAVNAVPMSESGRGYSQSAASTTFRWETVPARTGTGKESLVFTDSLAYTERSPLSKGISESGGGPTALAQANEAVAMSMADSNYNDRWSTGNKK